MYRRNMRRQDEGSFAAEFGQGMAVGQNLAEAADKNALNQRIEQMAAQTQEAGGDLNAIDPALYRDATGMKALGVFQQQYLSTKEGMLKSVQANQALAEHNYNQMAAGLQALEESKSNPQAFNAIVSQLTKSIGVPYYVQPDQEGKYQLMYNERNGDVATGKSLSQDELISYIQQQVQNKPQFMQTVGQHYLSTIMRNNEYKMKPETWMYTQEGKQLVPQKQYSAKTNAYESGYIMGDKFYSRQALSGMGITPLSYEQFDKGIARGMQQSQLNLAGANHQLARDQFDQNKQIQDANNAAKNGPEAKTEKLRAEIKDCALDLMASGEISTSAEAIAKATELVMASRQAAERSLQQAQGAGGSGRADAFLNNLKNKGVIKDGKVIPQGAVAEEPQRPRVGGMVGGVGR